MTTLEIILICVLAYVLLATLLMPLLIDRKSFGESLVGWLSTIFSLPLIIGLTFWYFVIEPIINRVSNRRQNEQPK